MTLSERYRLLAASQKAATGAPLYSVVVNRPVGRLFATAAWAGGLTPNQVTGISAIFTFIGIGVLAFSTPSVGVGLIVATCLVIGYALDSADGQLARVRGGGSYLGEWLDHLIDSAKIATLHLAVAVMIYRYGGLSPWWLVVPLIFSSASVVHFFGMILTELLGRIAGSPSQRQGGSSMMAWMKLPTDYGILCLSFVLVGAFEVFLWVYAALALAMVGYTALVVIVWYRRISGLERS